MLLTDTQKKSLFRRLTETDTFNEKVAFYQLIDTNVDVAQTYIRYKLAMEGHTPTTYRHYLQRELLPDPSFVTDVIADIPLPVPTPGLTERIGTYLGEWFDGLRARLAQPQWAGVALGCLLLIGVSIGWFVRQQAERRADNVAMKKEWANPFSMGMGSTPANPCDPDLKQQYYDYHPDTPSAELRQRISTLTAQTTLDPNCRAYYLGRTYLALDNYTTAIDAFQTARATTDPTLQDMATYDLALTYLLNGDPAQCRATLRTRPTWATPGLGTLANNLYNEAK